jgi:hypothetical protein
MTYCVSLSAGASTRHPKVFCMESEKKKEKVPLHPKTSSEQSDTSFVF